MGIVYRVWDLARRAALTENDYASPLAKPPYDLRHAAEWAGHSVNVLLRVDASCIVGQDDVARRHIQDALDAARQEARLETSPRIPHRHPHTAGLSQSQPDGVDEQQKGP